MGVRDDIQADLAAAMDSDLADTVEPFTAERVITSGTLDPVTGQYTGGTTETWTARWIRSEWSLAEMDSQHVELTDVKRIFLRSESDWQPRQDDTVGGLRVVRAWRDGAEATYTVQLRGS